MIVTHDLTSLNSCNVPMDINHCVCADFPGLYSSAVSTGSNELEDIRCSYNPKTSPVPIQYWHAEKLCEANVSITSAIVDSMSIQIIFFAAKEPIFESMQYSLGCHEESEIDLPKYSKPQFTQEESYRDIPRFIQIWLDYF